MSDTSEMKLWYVTIEYTGFVLAPTDEEAIDTAYDLLTDEEPDSTDAVEITATNGNNFIAANADDYSPYLGCAEDDVDAFVSENFPEDMRDIRADDISVGDWLKYLKRAAELAAERAAFEAAQTKLPEIP